MWRAFACKSEASTVASTCVHSPFPHHLWCQPLHHHRLCVTIIMESRGALSTLHSDPWQNLHVQHLGRTPCAAAQDGFPPLRHVLPALSTRTQSGVRCFQCRCGAGHALEQEPQHIASSPSATACQSMSPCPGILSTSLPCHTFCPIILRPRGYQDCVGALEAVLSSCALSRAPRCPTTRQRLSPPGRLCPGRCCCFCCCCCCVEEATKMRDTVSELFVALNISEARFSAT